LISTPEGKAFYVPLEAMGNCGFAVNSNYKISINGTSAWVGHDEESTAKDGKKTLSYEIRLLEKIKNKCKLV
jgi:hypothetical protein